MGFEKDIYFQEKYGILYEKAERGDAVCWNVELYRKKFDKGQKILFIHTGGMPLVFDYLERTRNIH